MNSKDPRASVHAVPMLAQTNPHTVLQILLVTVIFSFIVYLVCCLRIDLSILDILTPIFRAVGTFRYPNTPCILPKVKIVIEDRPPGISPKNHFILTAQCMAFAFIPLYANMLFELVKIKDRNKEPAENNFSCSFKCSLTNATKESIDRALKTFRSARKLFESGENRTNKSGENGSDKGKKMKEELVRDESLESRSTYCETPLFETVKIVIPVKEIITPFIMDTTSPTSDAVFVFC